MNLRLHGLEFVQNSLVRVELVLPLGELLEGVCFYNILQVRKLLSKSSQGSHSGKGYIGRCFLYLIWSKN